MHTPSITIEFSPATNHNEFDVDDWYIMNIIYDPYELRALIVPKLRVLCDEHQVNLNGGMHNVIYFKTLEKLSSFLTIALLTIEELNEFKLIGDLQDCL